MTLLVAGSLLLLAASPFTYAGDPPAAAAVADVAASAASSGEGAPTMIAATDGFPPLGSLAPVLPGTTGSVLAPPGGQGLNRLPTTPPPDGFLIPLPFDPPANRIKDHPLEGVIAFMRSGKSTETRDWVLPLLLKALVEPMREARITGYSSRDSDGGGSYTRWGTHVRWGICAADPRYWGPGSVIWMGDPVGQVLVVEDTGSAIKGRDRFDICVGDDSASSSRVGSRHANYVPLYIAPTTSRWGSKPDDWAPPLPAECHK